MARRVALPNGSVVSVATGLAAEVAITAIANGVDPTVTYTGTTLTDGDVVLLNSGWSRIDGKAVKVDNAVAGEFDAMGINTTDTDFFPAGSGSGSFQKVNGWVQISKVTGVNLTGGDQQYLTVGYLELQDDFQVPINRDPLSLSFTVEDQPTALWVAPVEEIDARRAVGAVKITFPDKSEIIFAGYLTITSMPTIERNTLMERTISVSMQAVPVRYNAP